ncbi:RloB domain-containing protein [Listeria booriae]|uniref:RloB domain-containing protein n=1 Tax=Listeria booriae TaxID=1552123 RepID=UPI00162900AB|nr:RloB domain-containing protein [Listeria booriae]MBC1919409.1 RloB domain-containing protein [Listeria booriae]MBC2067013.1 RloB domain-containing protein [Listeria booriae]
MGMRLPPNVRPHKKEVLVFVEGDCEKIYFDRVKELGIIENISLKVEKVKGKNMFVRKMGRIIRSKLTNNSNARFFIVLDMDNGASKQVYDEIKTLLKMERFAKNPEELIFITNYSFEFFLLNHKKNYSKPITSKKDYRMDIKKFFNVKEHDDSKKSWEAIINKITKADIEQAIKNTKSVSKNIDHNPCCSIDSLFETLKGIN